MLWRGWIPPHRVQRARALVKLVFFFSFYFPDRWVYKYSCSASCRGPNKQAQLGRPQHHLTDTQATITAWIPSLYHRATCSLNRRGNTSCDICLFLLFPCLFCVCALLVATCDVVTSVPRCWADSWQAGVLLYFRKRQEIWMESVWNMNSLRRRFASFLRHIFSV